MNKIDGLTNSNFSICKQNRWLWASCEVETLSSALQALIRMNHDQSMSSNSRRHVSARPAGTCWWLAIDYTVVTTAVRCRWDSARPSEIHWGDSNRSTTQTNHQNECIKMRNQCRSMKGTRTLKRLRSTAALRFDICPTMRNHDDLILFVFRSQAMQGSAGIAYTSDEFDPDSLQVLSLDTRC